MGNLGHKELDQLSFPSVEFLSAVISAAKQHFKKILEEQNSSFSASRNLLISRVNSPLSLCWSMFAGKRVYSSTVTINWEWTPLGHYAVIRWQVYSEARVQFHINNQMEMYLFRAATTCVYSYNRDCLDHKAMVSLNSESEFLFQYYVSDMSN